MKTAKEWRIQFNHMTTKPVAKEFFEQAVIEAIQQDAETSMRHRAAEVMEQEKMTVEEEEYRDAVEAHNEYMDSFKEKIMNLKSEIEHGG